jgi:DNA-binding NarL/FixJ family response regulator
MPGRILRRQGGRLTTKARIRYKKQERIHRQANDRIQQTLTGDQRRILALSREGYEIGEIARELALRPEYVTHFTTGLVQRLTHDGLIPAPEWRNVLKWVEAENILDE